MKIKEFVEEYNKRVPKLREQFLKENLKITTYVPYIKKDALAQVVAERTTYEQEFYTKEDGDTGVRNTRKIKVNTSMQVLLFCRVVIENYTNLEITDNDKFHEDYDLLNKSGILSELINDYEGHPSMIPFSELEELKGMIVSKREDILTNYATPQNYISNQIDKVLEIVNKLEPVLNKASIYLKDLDDDKLTRLEEIIKSGVSYFNMEKK